MGALMTDARAGGPSFYGIPLVIWIAVVAAILSAAVAVCVAWRSNAKSRRILDERLARHWQQVESQFTRDTEERARQHEREAKQLAQQLAHDAEQRARQLAHDAEQRERERKMSLRQEVCLEAAAALTNLLMLVGRAAHLDTDETAILDQFTTDQAKLARIHLVGSEATVDAVMTYLNELTPALLELITRRVPLGIRRRAIEGHLDLMNKAGADRERYATMLQQSPLESLRESSTWQAVETRYRVANEQFSAQQSITMKLRAEQTEEQMETGRRSASLAAQIARLLPGAMAAVRGELDLPLDRRRYEQLWNVQLSKIDYTWKQAMDRIRAASSQLPAAKSE
jgi:hypothetical protein